MACCLQEMRLPDRSQAVVGKGLATAGNTAQELPVGATISADVDIDLGQAEVSGDAVTSEQDRASRVASKGLGELVEEGLVAKTPAINSVLDTSDLRPAVTTVGRAPDGEVDDRGLRRVVLPSGDQVTRVQLDGASVQNARINPAGVGRRGEDDLIRDGTGGLASLDRSRKGARCDLKGQETGDAGDGGAKEPHFDRTERIDRADLEKMGGPTGRSQVPYEGT